VSRAAPGPEDRHVQNRGTDSGGTATGCAEAVVAPARPAGRALAALAGLRTPVVWILLAIAFFTSISGKPVDGVLMLIVAVGLAWDAGRRALRHPEGEGPAAPARTDRRAVGRRRVAILGWHGPVRARPDGGRLPVAGTLAWLVVLVAGCLWELSALIQQPSLTTDSYAHPTISTLTDPLLATSPGRMLILFAWVAFGWYLVER